MHVCVVDSWHDESAMEIVCDYAMGSGILKNLVAASHGRESALRRDDECFCDLACVVQSVHFAVVICNGLADGCGHC